MKLSLNCFVLGDTDTFTANVPEKYTNDNLTEIEYSALTVSNFTEIIKNQVKHAVSDPDDPNSMKLWQVDIDNKSLKNLSTEKDIENNFNGKMMKRAYPFSDYFPDGTVPTLRNIHIIVVPTTGLFEKKRKVTEEIHDVSAQILGAFNKRPKVTLPEVNELPAFLDLPLSDNMKIPILRHEYNSYLIQSMEDMCTSEDINILFRISDTESAYEFITKTFGSPIRNNPPFREGTECSFVQFWDNNIRSPLEALISNGISIRNSSQNTSTPGKRPDYAFILNHVCPFRGEEKSLINNEDPRAELIDKLSWIYDPAPYVFGYHANGPDVTFVAICRPLSTGNKPTIATIANSNLNLRRERIINLRRIINLSILIKSLQDVIGWRESPEFSPIVRDKQTIEVYGTNIKKTFTIREEKDSRVEKLKNVYNILTAKNVPNVDRLISADNKDGVVFLGPKGMSVKPNSPKELFEAVLCVLEALVVMHGGNNPIFHQDIRWPNIIKLSDEPPKWILIDWDDADSSPTRSANHLEKINHAPEVFLQGHGGEVDIWGVGRLITDAAHFIMGLPQSIIDIGVQMQSNDRPNALNALETWSHLNSKDCKNIF